MQRFLIILVLLCGCGVETPVQPVQAKSKSSGLPFSRTLIANEGYILDFVYDGKRYILHRDHLGHTTLLYRMEVN